MDRVPRRSVPLRPERRPARLQHVSALDGIRGVSVLAIVANHLAAPGWLSLRVDRHLFPLINGTAVTIDMFFVLSGVLITTLLLQEIERTERVDLRAFRVRRVRRLAPALLLALAAMIIASSCGESEALSGRPWLAVLCIVFLGANWLSATNQLAVGALGVTWTLSIEESFYLLWPYALGGLVRRGGTRLVAAALVAGVVLCVGYTAWAAHRYGDASRFHTPVHGVGLLVGALGAVVLRMPRVRAVVERVVAPPLVAAVALAGLVAVAYWGARQTPLRTQLLTTPEDVLAVAVVLHCVVRQRDGSWFTTAFSWRPIAYVGTISYGLYLFHVPVMYVVRWAGLAGARSTLHSAGVVLLVYVASIALASLSYETVERRVRRGGRVRSPRPAVPTSAAS